MLFKIIPARYFAALIGIMFALTLVLAFTNTMLISAADTLSSSAGSNSFTISSSICVIPQTGIVPAILSKKIGSLKGIGSISPEVISLVSVKNHTLFTRGVDLQPFGNLTNIRLLEGVTNLEYGDALVGIRAARLLNVHIGDKLLVVSVFANRATVSLTVRGRFETGEVFDDELITNTATARFLGGLKDDMVSIIRVKITATEARSELLTMLKAEKKESVSRDPTSIIPFLTSYPPSAQSAVIEVFQTSTSDQLAENAIGRARHTSSRIRGYILTVAYGMARSSQSAGRSHMGPVAYGPPIL